MRPDSAPDALALLAVPDFAAGGVKNFGPILLIPFADVRQVICSALGDLAIHPSHEPLPWGELEAGIDLQSPPAVLFLSTQCGHSLIFSEEATAHGIAVSH